MSKEHRTFGGQMELLPLGIFDATAEEIEWSLGQISTVTSSDSDWVFSFFQIATTKHCIFNVGLVYMKPNLRETHSC